MLCAKCQKNEATIHVTTVVGGIQQETVDFCTNCGPPSPSGMNHEQAMAEARSMLANKCGFCGAQVQAHHTLASGEAIYLCFDCEAERMSIVMELLETERPDLARTKDAGSIFDPVLSRRSIQLLKERRREDGRDKTS